MTTGGYYNPDLSGTDPAYTVTDDLYTIPSTPWKLVFDSPVFLSSIQAIILSTTNVPLVEGVDYTYTSGDVATTETAKMLSYSSTFSAVLVDSIEITRAITAPINVNLSYQKLYPVTANVVVFDNQRVNFTPDTVVSIMQRLANLELLTKGVANNFTNSSITPRILPVDLTGTAASNLITGETYAVNVLQLQNGIITAQGPYYENSLVITLDDGLNTRLVKDVDYQTIGLDVARTRLTDSTSAVKLGIIVTKPYVGNLALSYQAFGGEVTVASINDIYAMVQNIDNYLEGTQFLTPTSIASTNVMQNVLSRIASLEANMRSLLVTGSANYSDVTGNGQSSTQKLQAVDTNLHWYSIATLYKVAINGGGLSDVILADRMHFRFQLANSHISADVFVNVDLTLTNPFQIDSISVNMNNATAPFVCPHFRIIYNQGLTSGVILQIGLNLPSLIETLAMQDLSGSQSCWIMTPTQANVVPPLDNTITLPDGTSIYDTSNSNSVSIVHAMPTKLGYQIFNTSTPIQNLANTPITTSIPSFFQISDLKTIELDFTRADGEPITLNVPVSKDSSGKMQGAAYIPSASPGGSPTLVTASISVSGSLLALLVNPEITASSPSMNLVRALIRT